MDNVVHQPRYLPENELDFLEVILQALVRYMPVLRADPEVPQEVLAMVWALSTTSTETSGSSIFAWFSIMYIKREWEKNRINPKYMFNENVEEMVDLAVYIEQGLLDVPKPRDNIFGKRKNTEKL